MANTPLLKCFVDGDFVDSSTHFDNINPVNGSVISQLAEADHSIIDQAVTAARNSTWSKLTTNQRCELLHRVADRMAEREQEFIDAEMADTGKSLFQVKTIDIPRGTLNFRTFADMVKFHTGFKFFIVQT